MTGIAICSFLIGAVFGLRFRVMVLLPLTVAIALIAILPAIVFQLSLLQYLANSTICALSLQGGYLFGSFARFTVAATRGARVVEQPLKIVR